MRNFLAQKEFIDIISKSQKEFEKNLKNKKLMFVYENKDKTIGEEEMFFPTTSFYHLTGVKAYDSNNQSLNSYKFYELLKLEGIDESKIEIKDKTTYYKLQILPQLMQLDRMASMIGNFTEYSLLLQTNKLVGNVNACMGFIKSEKSNMYIPNTALKEDIRDITNDRKKIVAVLKKEINEKLYKNITYLKQNYSIASILQNKEINKKIDINNVYSNNKIVDKEIYEFMFSKEKDKSQKS